MNDEERKAIEKFKFCGGNFVLDKESSKVVLNLIEKLKKENEELKEYIAIVPNKDLIEQQTGAKIDFKILQAKED